MAENSIKISEVTRNMTPEKQKETAEKCRKASLRYAEISALLDEAGVAMENNNFDTCIAKLSAAKDSLH